MSLKRSKSALNPAAGILTPRSKSSGKEKKKEKSSAKRHKTAEIERKPSMDDHVVSNDQPTVQSPIQSPNSTPMTTPRENSSPPLQSSLPVSSQPPQNSSALQRSISVTHNNSQKSPPQAQLLADIDQYSKGGLVWKRKKQKKTFSNWKLRYLHLKNAKLLYYASAADIKPLGEFNLLVTHVRKQEVSDSHKKGGRNFVFELKTLGSVYDIATEQEEEVDQWLFLINQVKNHLFQKGIDINKDAPTPNRPPPKKNLASRFATLRGQKKNHPDFSRMDIVGTFAEPKSHAAIPRDACLAEIINTERDYVADLLIIVNHYIGKLEDYGLLAKDKKDEMFGNIEEMVPLHQQFLSELEVEYAKPTPDFSYIFSNFVPKLSIYSNYCTAQSSAVDSIREYSNSNPNFGLCLDNLKTDPEAKNMDIYDFLIKPMQRLCKYPLLLKELMRYTDDADPCHERLKFVYNSTEKIIAAINENKRTVDSLVSIIAIQRMIIDKELNLHAAKNRHLIGENEFRKLSFDNGGSFQKVQVWLFTDLLLFAKKKTEGKFNFKTMIQTNEIVVWDLDPSNNSVVPETKFGFSIVSTNKSVVDKIVVLANTAQEKTEWINLINSTIGSLV